ncbi:MAG: sn-glycerol-1-phosphate dehydrogenase [Chloroflexi bacterium]|nr:sn-glycerol-1-phosphate dehydrogenase [Chloroflexota bacterium]
MDAAFFQFDPGDYPAFQAKVRGVVPHDPFAGSALREIVLQEDGIFELPALLRRIAPGLSDVAVVMDKTPMYRAGASLKPLVLQLLTQNGYQVTVIKLEGDAYGIVHPDFERVEVVRQQVRPGMIVIGLGSGVIADICKYACFMVDQANPGRSPVPLVSIPTANSVPAFSSSLAIISRDGVKRTWPTRLPDAILYDLQTLRDCPHPLTLGGLGDMCAMYIASVEWYLGVALGVVADSPASRAILNDARALLVQHAAAMGEQSLAGMEILAKILTLGGLAMTFAGDSTPMSGYEHGMAHLLDMSAGHFQRSIRNHGSQVAVGGIYVLIGLETFLARFDPATVVVDRCYPDFEVMEARIRGVFAEIDPSGAMGAECWRDYHKKLVAWQKVRPGFERLLENWDEVRQAMQRLLLPARTYAGMLHAAGHPMTFAELDVPEEQVHWAYRHAYMLRKRLSTTDLLVFMNWMDARWEQDVFAAAAGLVRDVRQFPPPF